MSAVVEQKRGQVVYLINLDGRLDSGTAPEFERFFINVIEKGRIFLVLESTALEFVTSAGIAALIRSLTHLRDKNGGAAFVGLNEEITLLLEFFRINELAPAFRTIDEAENYLNSKASAFRVPLKIFEEKPVTSKFTDSGVVFEKKRELSSPSGFEFEEAAEPLTVSASPLPGAAHTTFKEALVISCTRCGEKLRIYHAGRHLCPSCHFKFSVKNDGAVTFT